MINHMKRLGIPCTQTLKLMSNLQLKSQKRGTIVASEKEKDTPQLSHALQEFVKHIANPLVDKGWNLHLKFGRGGAPRRAVYSRFFPMGAPQLKLTKKEKVSKPQISKEIPT